MRISSGNHFSGTVKNIVKGPVSTEVIAKGRLVQY
jgi:molybdopterin-binding protein